jgi:hypothetical protein
MKAEANKMRRQKLNLQTLLCHLLLSQRRSKLLQEKSLLDTDKRIKTLETKNLPVQWFHLNLLSQQCLKDQEQQHMDPGRNCKSHFNPTKSKEKRLVA